MSRCRFLFVQFLCRVVFFFSSIWVFGLFRPMTFRSAMRGPYLKNFKVRRGTDLDAKAINPLTRWRSKRDTRAEFHRFVEKIYGKKNTTRGSGGGTHAPHTVPPFSFGAISAAIRSKSFPSPLQSPDIRAVCRMNINMPSAELGSLDPIQEESQTKVGHSGLRCPGNSLCTVHPQQQ